ncbi:MAG: glucosamine-6-phosphate deaminase [Flavisolibacter sp.]
MEIILKPTYEDMCRQAADVLSERMQSSANQVLCLASGDTPSGLYKEIVNRVLHHQLDVSRWKFVGLDEWAGMNGKDEGSCRYHLDRQFFHPLHIREAQICFFDGRAKDLQEECGRTEAFIQEHGGIDVAILGLGLNGHIGMNEPGTSPSLRSHVTAIDEETQKVGQKYFSTAQTISEGITLGLANLMEASQVMLMVSGAHKAGIVKRILEEEISDQLPATILRKHPGLKLFVDGPAGKLLQS